ncbi:MAG: GH3 auxin-responsive promoter family protein, partial [Actinomycetota bacterium]
FFVALADEADHRYRLYLESPDGHPPPDGPAIGAAVDRLLADGNIEYGSKRSSGRLGPMEGVAVEPGTGADYRRRLVADGQRDAQFKFLHLQYRKDCAVDFDAHAVATEPDGAQGSS